MQQGRGGMGSHKHGTSGHAAQSPRFRLNKKLAAERGEYDTSPRRRPLHPALRRSGTLLTPRTSRAGRNPAVAALPSSETGMSLV